MAELATDRGHRFPVDRPDNEDADPIAAAERVAAQISSREHPLGSPGSPFNWHSPFLVGLTASAGVAVTYGVVRALGAASSMLLLIGMAFFVALGLEPAVSWLAGKRLPRWAAVTAVLIAVMAVPAGTIGAAPSVAPVGGERAGGDPFPRPPPVGASERTVQIRGAALQRPRRRPFILD